MPKSILHQAELASVAYVGSFQAGTSLQGVKLLCDQAGKPSTGEEVTRPNIIFRAEAPVELAPGSGMFEFRLKATIETQMDDETNSGPDLHHSRVSDLRALLESDQIYSVLNPPASGADLRAVSDFALTAIYLTAEEQKQEDRVLSTALTYYVCAAT